MFYSLVDESVEELYSKIVTGDLLVSLDSLKEFVYFIIIADGIQSTNRKEYSLFSFNNMLSGSEKLQEDEDLHEFLEEYDRVAHHYKNLNYKNQLEAKIRAKTEEKDGKSSRFEGKRLYDFHVDEFLELMKIKSDSSHEFHKTYKRIVSEKGYLSRITYTEYKSFYEYLFDLIDEDDPPSNIKYYKLEKRMGLEIQKAILTAMKKKRESKIIINDDELMRDLLMVTKIPLIGERHRLVEIYSGLDHFEDILKWRNIVGISINRFINYAIQHVQHHIKSEKYNVLESLERSKFQSIYLPSSFYQDYKLRRDFSASDFKKLMKYMDDNTIRI